MPRDTHGNIVVDPAGNINKEQYLLDYNIYRELHDQAMEAHKNGGDGRKKIANMTQQEIKEIKQLFAGEQR